MRDAPVLACAIGLFLVLVGLSTLAGCGGPPDAVRTTLAVTEQAVTESDDLVAPRYHEAAQRAHDGSTTAAEYAAVMQPWDRAEEALRASVRVLLAAHDAVDAWAAGEGHWADVAACVVDALGQLTEGLRAVHLTVPGLVGQALALARGFVTGTCPAGGAP